MVEMFSPEERLEQASLAAALQIRELWQQKCSSEARLLEAISLPDALTLIGYSKSFTGNGRREHVVPRAVIIEECHRMLVRGATDEALAKVIRHHVKIVMISDEECERLDSVAQFEVRPTMPRDWRFGDNPFARFEMAGIEWIPIASGTLNLGASPMSEAEQKCHFCDEGVEKNDSKKLPLYPTQPLRRPFNLEEPCPPIPLADTTWRRLLFSPSRLSFFLGLKQFERQAVCTTCRGKFWRRARISLATRTLAKFLLYTGAVAFCAYLIGCSTARVDHWRDTAILFAAWIVALAFLFMAYEKGGRVWVIRHAMITDTVRTTESTIKGAAGLGALISIFRPPFNEPAVADFSGSKNVTGVRKVRARFYSGWIFRRSLHVPGPRLAPVESQATEGGDSKVWDERLWRRCVSGFWGEAVIVSAAIAICMVIVWQCNMANIVSVLRDHPIKSGSVMLVVAIVVTDYNFRQVNGAISTKRHRAYCGNLADAYADYGVYSWFLFTFGALILGLLALEFALHEAKFYEERKVILGYLADAAAKAQAADWSAVTAVRESLFHHSLTEIELAYGGLSDVYITLQDQINPILIFAALLISINILIRHTDLKHLFADDARFYTMVFTYAPLALVVTVGTLIYVESYYQLMSGMSSGLLRAAPNASADAEVVKRYDEIAGEVARNSNIFGFAQAVGGVGSAAPIFLAFLKEILDRLGERESLIEAGDMLLRRPHSRFRPTTREPEAVVFQRAKRNTLRMRKARPGATV
jgi:hypothetical protein